MGRAQKNSISLHLLFTCQYLPYLSFWLYLLHFLLPSFIFEMNNLSSHLAINTVMEYSPQTFK